MRAARVRRQQTHHRLQARRSDIVQDLAASHTGALAGADEVADAYFRSHGMLRVEMLETLFELPALIAGQKPAKRHRVAVMTTTGGGAAAVVDRLGTFGVEVVPPSDRVVDQLARKKITIPRTRLTDLTLAGAKKEIYSAVLGELLASDHADLVLAVVGSSAALHPQIAIEPIAEAQRGGKPLAAFSRRKRNIVGSGPRGSRRFPQDGSCAAQFVPHTRLDPARRSAAADSKSSRGRPLKTIPGSRSTNSMRGRGFAGGYAPGRDRRHRKPDQAAGSDFPVLAKILSPEILHKRRLRRRAQYHRWFGVADGGQRDPRARKDHTSSGKINGILVQRMEKGSPSDCRFEAIRGRPVVGLAPAAYWRNLQGYRFAQRAGRH